MTKQQTLEDLLAEMPKNWERWGDDEIACPNYAAAPIHVVDGTGARVNPLCIK